MLWNRKPSATAGTKQAGLDVSASRARAVLSAAGACRVLPLSQFGDLPFAVHLDRRHAEVGPAAVADCRRTPHAVAAGFLAKLGVPMVWKGPRLSVTPEQATFAAFEALRVPLSAEAGSCGLVLPSYLTAMQVKTALELAGKAKLGSLVSASTPLAVAAHRATGVLTAPPRDESPRAEGVVPFRTPTPGPGSVLLIDADDFALSAAVVQIEPGEVKLLASRHWPRAGVKFWLDRLIDGVADKCVRVCRRDPRDSADAEQMLFDQLLLSLPHAAAGRAVVLNVRTAHWYQDLTFSPADFAALASKLHEQIADGLSEVLAAANLAVPPRTAWVSADANLLPGLSAAVYDHLPESCPVAVLPPTAGAEAAAALLAQKIAGHLPSGHLDVAIPLPAQPSVGRASQARAKTPS